MKIRSVFSSFLVLFVTIQLYSQDRLLELIPKDASFVVTAVLENKLSWKSASELSFTEEALRFAAQSLKINDAKFLIDLVRNPNSKGISMPNECFAFGESADESKFINIILPISDVSLFKNEMSTYFGPAFNNSIIAKGQQLCYIHNAKTALSWNKDFVIFTYLFNFGSEINEEIENDERLSLETYLDKINSLSPSNSIANMSQFTTWKSNLRDAGVWVDYKEILRLNIANELGRGEMPVLVRNLSDFMLNLYGDIYMASDISFEKGGIFSDTYIYADKDLIELSKAATSNRANKKMLKYIDGQKTGLYMTMATSPKGVYEGLKKFLGEKSGPLKSTVADLFGILEIFIDEKDAFNFLKGDLLYALNGLKTVERVVTDYEYDSETDEYIQIDKKTKEQIPLLSVGFSYGNKEQMLKFMRIYERAGFLKKIKSNLFLLSIPTLNETIYVKMDKGLMVLSNDEQRMLENKKYRPLSKKHSKFLKTDFQTLYVNTAAIADVIIGSNPPNDMKQVLKNLKDGLGDIELHSLRPKKSDKYFTMKFKLDLKNKEENALKQLFDFTERIYMKTLKGI